MKSSYFAVAAASGPNKENIVPYFGRDGVVVPTDLVYQQAVESLIDASTSIAAIALSRKTPMWTSLSEELALFSHGFLDPKIPIRRYQLDLLVETVLPYLLDRKNQIHTNASRFLQIETLLHILSGSDSSQTNLREVGVGNHPYHSLIKIEKVIILINREGGLWKSKLSTSLEQGVKKQWAPIIEDHQRALSSIGGKLCILGLVEAVGRPIMMLYPLYLVTQEALKVASEIEVKKTISAHSIMQIVKMLAMLLAVVQLSGILSMYTGLGYTCLAMGSCALFISSNDELTKCVVPVLAPHISSIDVCMDHLYQLERTAVNAFSRTQTTTTTSSSSSSSSSARPSSSTSSSHEDMPTDSRVEELPSEDTSAKTGTGIPVRGQVRTSTNTSTNTSSARPESTSVPNRHENIPITTVISPLHQSQPSQLQSTVTQSVTQSVTQRCREDDDYIFAELDVYTTQTQNEVIGTSNSQSESSADGLRQRRHA